MSGRPRRKEQPFRGVQGSKVHKAKHKFSSANDRLQRPPKPLAKKTAEDLANERNQGSNSIDTGPKVSDKIQIFKPNICVIFCKIFSTSAECDGLQIQVQIQIQTRPDTVQTTTSTKVDLIHIQIQSIRGYFDLHKTHKS